jgi:predicted nucleic acid-binding protein
MGKTIDYHIYVDTNVLVNFCTGQQDDVACLQYLFSKKRKETLFISALALIQTASQLQKSTKKRKALSREKVIEFLNFFIIKFTVLDLAKKDVSDSLLLKNNDLEDNVHFFISQKQKCARIITNNIRDFAQFAGIEALKPSNFALIKKIK